MRIELTDIKGSKISVSRNPKILRNIDTSDLPDSDYISEFKKRYEKKDIKEFFTLDYIVKVYPENNNSPVFYPAFENNEERIDLRLFSNKKDAETAQIKSVKIFYEKLFVSELKNLQKQINLQIKKPEYFSYTAGKKKIENGIYESLKNRFFLKNIKEKNEFLKYADEIKKNKSLISAAQGKKDKTEVVIEKYHNLITFLNSLEKKYINTKLILEIIRDCRKNANSIVPSNFYRLYSDDELENLPRYLDALKIRAERGIAGPGKDALKNKIILKFQNRLNTLLNELDENSSQEKRKATEAFFWDIEELKISVFAQEIKTKYPVSEKKLAKKFTDISKMV